MWAPQLPFGSSSNRRVEWESIDCRNYLFICFLSTYHRLYSHRLMASTQIWNVPIYGRSLLLTTFLNTVRPFRTITMYTGETCTSELTHCETATENNELETNVRERKTEREQSGRTQILFLCINCFLFMEYEATVDGQIACRMRFVKSISNIFRYVHLCVQTDSYNTIYILSLT